MLSIDRATDADLEFIRELRNDPLNASAFVNNNYITQESHALYMAEHMHEYFVCTKNGMPVGFIGVVDNDIRLAVAHHFRNKGVAKYMVTEILKIFPNAVAKVKVTNKASIALFESLGFVKTYQIYGKPREDK